MTPPPDLTRRAFLGGAVAGALAAPALGGEPAPAAPRTATDWVPLGRSGVKVTRLGMGTGSMGGKVQRDLGQEHCFEPFAPPLNRWCDAAQDRGRDQDHGPVRRTVPPFGSVVPGSHFDRQPVGQQPA